MVHDQLIHPFDMSGIVSDDLGVKHFADLSSSLVEMLRRSVDEAPDRDAVVELDGPRLTYRGLWDAAARGAGGLREAGVGRGGRGARGPGNKLEWVLAFFGPQLAGGVLVPVNTRFAEPEVDYVVTDWGAKMVLPPDEPLPDGSPYA